MPPIKLNRRNILLATSLLIVIFLLSSLHPDSPTNKLHNYGPFKTSGPQDLPYKHTRIFVASAFAAHFDVYLIVAGIAQRLLAAKFQPGKYSLHVYTFQPMRYKFQEVIDANTGLYNGTIISNDNFESDFENAFKDEFPPTLLVLGTCEVDMPTWSDRLLKLWDSLPSDKKFEVVCGIHNVGDNQWQQNQLPQWARRGAVRAYGISEHTSKQFNKKLLEMAHTSTPTYYTADMAHIKTDYIAPVLDLRTTFLEAAEPPSPELSNVAIQGSFELARRDYAPIFNELETSLRHDAAAWGYAPATSSTPFEPIAHLHPFVLHIMGNGREADLKIPPALENVVKVWKDLDYPDYYKKIASMNLVLPAFSGPGYYESQGSSTVGIAVQCNTPLLITKHFLSSYTYLDTPSLDFAIARPIALREVDALKLLRTRKLPESYWTNETEPPTEFSVTRSSSDKWLLPIPPRLRAPQLWDEIDEMISAEKPWKKDVRALEAAKQAIWKRNEETVSKILRGI